MPAWITSLAGQFSATGRTALLAAGAVIALAVAALIVRALRRTEPDQLAVRVAVLLASAFSAQGMYDVATQRLNLPIWLASGLFVVAESAMLASAVRAHRHHAKHGALGPNGRFVWLIATGAGIVVSLNAKSPSEYVLRLLMPLLVAGLWRMGYVSDEAKARVSERLRWAWTWQRIAERLGLVEPEDRDVTGAYTARQRRLMAAHAHSYHRGSLLLGWWHAARLRKLALHADDETVSAVQADVDRVHRIESLTAPKTTGVRLPSGWWRRPWRAAQQLAVLATQLGSERDAARVEVERLASESTRVATSVAELTTRLTETAAAHAAELDAARRDGDDRVEAERSARAELSREIESLRETTHRPQRREPSRPANRAAPTRRGAHVVSAITSDDAVADQLYGLFCEQVELTGELPSGHWVHVTGSAELAPRKVSSRQAYRVVEILKSRFAESSGRSESTPRESDDSADDSERELAEALA